MLEAALLLRGFVSRRERRLWRTYARTAGGFLSGVRPRTSGGRLALEFVEGGELPDEAERVLQVCGLKVHNSEVASTLECVA
jgi:hypothetical protein